MKTLRIMVLSIGLGAFMFGCSNSKVVGEMKAFADKTCECKDAACVEKVQGEMIAWLGTMKDEKGTESDAKKIAEHTKRMQECATKIAAGGAGE